MPQQTPKPPTDQKPKKPYCPPRVKVYGDFQRLTLGGGGIKGDVGQPTMA